MEVMRLACDGLEFPMGLRSPYPELSWQLGGAPPGGAQEAYRVIVGTSTDALDSGVDVWDSGWVVSDVTRCRYEGRATASRERLWWRVGVRDAESGREEWSSASWWEGGLFGRDDWEGRWIRRGEAQVRLPDRAAYVFRKRFDLSSGPLRGRVYATALGVYELYVNGEVVGDSLFRPGWTDYSHRIQYQVYDVTALLRQGANVVGALVAPGWFAGRIASRQATEDPAFTEVRCPELLLQLEAEGEGGTRKCLTSDESWEWAPSAVLASDMYDGEVWDRRLLAKDWFEPRTDGDGNGWAPVIVSTGTAGELVAEHSEPVRVLAVKEAQMHWCSDGSLLVDSGENDAGFLRIVVEEAPGRRIEVSYGEVLDPRGELYRENLRRANCTDVFVCAGGGEEVLAPLFTYRGFRYALVKGLSDRSALRTVEAVSVGSDLRRSGWFHSSNKALEQIYGLAVCSLRSNYVEVPTDCPQRGERLGWMADASLFSRFASYTYDIETFMSKWFDDILDARGPQGQFVDIAPRASAQWWSRPPNGAPAWADAGVQLPWLMYQTYGQAEFLQRMFPAVIRWLEWLHGVNPDGLWSEGRGNDYGDWVPAGPDTSHELFGTCWMYWSTVVARQWAEVMGKAEVAGWLAERADHVRESFHKRFVEAETGRVRDESALGSTISSTHFAGRVATESQTGYVMALVSGVVDGELAKKAGQRLCELVIAAGRRLETGIVGSAFLLGELERAGRPGLAYDLLLREEYPSLGFMASKGATSVWERWEGLGSDGWPACPTMNSFNHYALGSMLSWLVEAVCGLRRLPGVPAFREVRFAPTVSRRLRDAAFEFESPRGRIEVGWQWRNDTEIVGRVVVPSGVGCSVAGTISVDDELGAAVLEGDPGSGAAGAGLTLRGGSHEVVWRVRG